MITITEQDLNKAYTHVNYLYRQGVINKGVDVSIKAGENNLTFRFFPKMGRRGSWCITTDVNVKHYEE